MKKFRSQPRLAGNRREPAPTCLPPHVDKALHDIAIKEKKSLSWVRAQIIYDYFGLDESGWFAKNERRRA